MTEFASPGSEIPRDRFGRPLVVHPDGGKAVAYTRCTTYVGCLEDRFRLEKWKCRQVAVGLVEREDLHLAVAAHRDDKRRLDDLCEQAIEAAKASAAAVTGTALHALLDQWDRGTLDLNKVPKAYRPDIEAYARATEHLEVVAIEQFGVIDALRIGGTWDRMYRSGARLFVGDTKSGTIEYGTGKIAMQMSVYAKCTPYTHEAPAESRRGPSNPDAGVDQALALIVHLPAGKGECNLIEVDIAAGWAAVDLATQVRAWRARKNLTLPHVPGALAVPPRSGSFGRTVTTGDPILDSINHATSVAELRLLWSHNLTDWTAEYTAAAATRKQHLIDNPTKETA